MNYNSDKPIETVSEDLLGRSFFSKQFGKAIYEYNLKDGLVIGLYGKWGTGKTSIINMALSEIEELSKKDTTKPIVLKFSPWNFSDKNNLIGIFFQCLKGKIAKHKKQVNWEKVGKALDDYSGALDAISYIPVPGAALASEVVKNTVKAQGQRLAGGESLDDMKEKLEKALIKGGQKIVVVIDDIDRLTNSQIRDVFQLVKQVANFPNVIYVMAMDRDVVVKALEGVNGVNGQEYLEKIVQVTFEIPELKKSRLNEVFFDKLDNIIKGSSYDVQLDQRYWSEVFYNCISPYLRTLRDVNRVINTFQFRYSLLYSEISFEDMVAITTIEVLEPQLYKWILHNKEAVCGGFTHSYMAGIRAEKIDFRKKYDEEFRSMGIDSELAIRCLATLFPVFAKDVNEYSLGYQSATDLRSKMRMAQDNRFDLYFMSDLEDVKVSRDVINACIYELDKEAIEKTIFQVNKENNIIYFLEELRSLIKEIPYDRLPIIALALLRGGTKLKGESRKSMFNVSAIDNVEFVVHDILVRLKTSEERSNVLSEAIGLVDKNGLSTLGTIINRIELAYGRLAGEVEKKDDQIVTIQQLEQLENQYVNRIKELSKNDLLLDIDGYGIVLYLWKCFDNKSAKKYMTEILKDDVVKLKFICSMAGRWNGTRGSGWNFHSESYSEYLSDEEIYALIQKMNINMINEFSEIDQIKLASFVLNYNKDEIDHVTEEEAKEQVKLWKHKIDN